MLLNSAGNSCRCAVFLAASFFISSPYAAETQPKPRSLSEYSNEEIVAEYHRRLSQFEDEVALPLVNKISAAYEKSGISGLRNEDTLSFDEISAVIAQGSQYLRPFAEAGDLGAMELVGRHMMNDLDPKVRCEGYTMLRSAAVDGALGAILTLSSYYHRPYDKDQSNEKLMFLWSREGLHRSPDLFVHNFEVTQAVILQDRLDKYEKDWIEWSPEEAPLKLHDGCP